MIELESLHLEHIMCIDEADLDLSSNVVILEGDNGQGKSAVMEAIAVCLAERKRADSVKEFVQKGFEHAKIILKMKYNSAPIIFNVTLNVRGGTPLERDVEYEGKHYINSEVTDLLKELDFTFYSEIILSMQGQDDIATMTPVQRANLLQRLFQFDFTEKIKGINDKIQEAQDAIKLDNSKIEYLTKELTSKEARRNSVTLKEPPFDSETYRAKQHEQDELFANLADIKNKSDEIYSLQTKRNTISSKINTASFKLQELSHKKEDAQKAKADLEALQYDFKIKQAQDILDANAVHITECNTEIANVQKQIDELNNSHTVRLQNIATCNYKKAEFDKKLKLMESGVCPECGQSTCNMDHEGLKKDIAENDNEIVRITELNNSDTETLKALREKREGLKSTLQTFNNTNISFKSSIELLNSSKKQLESKIMPLEEYEKLEADIAAALEEKNNLNTEYNEISEKISKMDDIKSKQDSIEKAYNKIKEEVKLFDDAMIFNEAAQRQIEQFDEDIHNSKLNIEEIKNAVSSLTRDIECYDEVKKVLDKELPNFLIVKTCSKLESEMNTFVQEVFPEFRIRLLQSKRGVEFFYTTDPNNDMEDVKSLINSKMASGYERSVLGIAFKVALCRAYGLTFVALDEIDAAASDENSMKTFQSLINSNVFEQMIFITHKEPTKEMIKAMTDDVTAYHVESGVFTNDEAAD